MAIRWFKLGDYPLSPSNMPSRRDGMAYTVYQNQLWVLGGWNSDYVSTTNTVYRYDIEENTWYTGTPVSFSFESYSRAVVIAGKIYFATPNGQIHSYDTSNGTTASLASSGITGYHDLVQLGSYIYLGLSTDLPRRYDPGTDTWENAPGGSPIEDSFDYAAVVQHLNGAFVLGGNFLGVRTAKSYIYRSDGSWVALPDLPAVRMWHSAVVYKDQVLVFGGEGTTSDKRTVALKYDLSGWEEPYSDMPYALAGQAAEVLMDRVVVAGGYDYLDDNAGYRTLILGEGFDAISLSGGVSLGIPIETDLLLRGDVVDGPGTVTSILLTGELGSFQETILFLTGSVISESGPTPGGGDGELPPPEEGQPDPLFPPGVDIGIHHKSGNWLSYNVSESVGGGATGAMTFLRERDGLVPFHLPPLEYEAARSYGWSRAADVTSEVQIISLTQQALSTFLLPEIMPVKAINDMNALLKNPVPNCAFSLDAELCEESWTEWLAEICEHNAKKKLRLPQRIDLARNAARYVGVDLIVIEGPGLYGINEVVDEGFRTERKTALAVISELLLQPGPRTWFTPGVMHIDGRELPEATLDPPEESLIFGGELWEDTIVDSGTIQEEFNFPEAYPPAPSLSEFLARCQEDEEGGTIWAGSFHSGGGPPGAGDGQVGDFYMSTNVDPGTYYEKVSETQWTKRGNAQDLLPYPVGTIVRWRVRQENNDYMIDYKVDVDTNWNMVPNPEWEPAFNAMSAVDAAGGCARTFETVENGSYAWRETSGHGSDYLEVDYRIVKEGGNVVSETKVTRGKRYAQARWWITDNSFMYPLEWVFVNYEYASCCAGALVRKTEQVYVSTAITEYNNLGEPVLPNPGDSGTILSLETVMVQRWHAEGWLRSKIETRKEFDQWVVTNYGTSLFFSPNQHPTYKNSSRDEVWIPVGGGLWWNQITESGISYVAIWAPTGGPRREPSELRASPGVNTYRVVSDGGPPTVSCIDDPCHPDETCEQKAHREYQEALKAWIFEVGIVDAGKVNRPERLLKQQFSIGWAEIVNVGDIVQTSRGSGIVTRVGWSGTGPQAGSPGESVTVEIWSRSVPVEE